MGATRNGERGAWILGRNKFGPVRGEWPDESWKGWWGETSVSCADVRATHQQYLRPGLIDELHLAFRPILMGAGENLFAGIDLAELGYWCTQHVSTDLAVHVVVEKIV